MYTCICIVSELFPHYTSLFLHEYLDMHINTHIYAVNIESLLSSHTLFSPYRYKDVLKELLTLTILFLYMHTDIYIYIRASIQRHSCSFIQLHNSFLLHTRAHTPCIYTHIYTYILRYWRDEVAGMVYIIYEYKVYLCIIYTLYTYRCAYICTLRQLFRDLFSHATLADMYILSVCIYICSHTQNAFFVMDKPIYIHIFVYIYKIHREFSLYMHIYIYNWRKHCLHTRIYRESKNM